MTYFVHYIVGDKSKTIYKGQDREKAVKVAEAKFEKIKANGEDAVVDLCTPSTKWAQLGWSIEEVWCVDDD